MSTETVSPRERERERERERPCLDSFKSNLKTFLFPHRETETELRDTERETERDREIVIIFRKAYSTVQPHRVVSGLLVTTSIKSVSRTTDSHNSTKHMHSGIT